jgi:hypothetical protein
MYNRDEAARLVAVGDILPKNPEIFDPTRSIIKGADVAFGQLEVVLSRRGTRQVFEFPAELNRRLGQRPSAPPIHVSSDPEILLNMISDVGFNIMSFAANHAYMYGDEGVIDTVAALKSKNIACIGAGKDIIEATKPAVFEKKGQNIGFLAYCSVVPPGGWATFTKPGVAPLRANTAYEQIDWQPGSPPRTISWCNKDDITGMVEDIKKLRSQVDVVVVSMHWGVHFVPGLIADYQVEAGHAAIDAGADLILGHHPHILKGIEVYKGKVIFYSLANYCCSSSNKFSAIQASGIFWMNRFGLRVPVDMEHPTYPYPVDSQKTILVKCDIADKKLQRVAYLPLWMNVQNQAEVVYHSDKRSEEHLKYMRWICGSQGLDTHFTREGDEVVITTQ